MESAIVASMNQKIIVLGQEGTGKTCLIKVLSVIGNKHVENFFDEVLSDVPSNPSNYL
mgnify:CR=1 FL=1